MALPVVMSDMSVTPASNTPAGTEAPTNADDYLRSIQAILRTTNAKGSDLAAASTTDIGAATAEFVDITGTTTITALGTIAAGIVRTVRFTGALTLTYNATSLILPGSANITTANGDVAEFRSLGSGNWVCTSYVKRDGTQIVSQAPFIDSTAIIKGSADATKLLKIEVDGLTTATTRTLTAQDNNYTIGAQDISRVNGRLTLTTVTPVTTADVTAATTIYFTPYQGNKISVYDGSASWLEFTFTELSLSVPATTSTMYDMFVYNNAGTLTLEALAWTNDTTRATALVLQNGVLVKSGATTRRYLGSFRTTAVSGQTEDSVSKRYVWNNYNRIRRYMSVIDATNSWTYTTATWRQANAAATNQVEAVIGVAEDAADAIVTTIASNSSAGVFHAGGVGINSTSVNSAQTFGCAAQVVNIVTQSQSKYKGILPIGRNTIVWLEISQATGTTTFIGDNGSLLMQSGLHAEVFA